MCYLLHFKKEETQRHILSLLCCLRAGSQHLVVSLIWEISGGRHGAARQCCTWEVPGFPFQEEVKDGQVFPLGQQWVWQKEELAWSHSEFFLTTPQELPKKSHQGKLWHRPSKNKGQGEGSARDKHKTLQGAMVSSSQQGRHWWIQRQTHKKRIQLWVSQLGLKYAKPAWIHNTQKKNFLVDLLYNSYISEESLTEDRRKNRKEETSIAARSCGSSLLQHLPRPELPDAMNECQLQPTVQNADSPSTAKSTRSRGFIPQMRLSLQVKGL